MTQVDGAAMSGGLKRQVPTFALIGAFGYVVDSSLTYALVRWGGLDPLTARLPAFSFATVVNFALNRALTFTGSRAPLLQAFVKYVAVCAAGLAINWSVYASALVTAGALGLPTGPQMLPLFVAAGTGVAMFATFFGFKLFAFQD